MIINSRIWPFDSIDLSFEWLSLLLYYVAGFGSVYQKRGKMKWGRPGSRRTPWYNQEAHARPQEPWKHILVTWTICIIILNHLLKTAWLGPFWPVFAWQSWTSLSRSRRRPRPSRGAASNCCGKEACEGFCNSRLKVESSCVRQGSPSLPLLLGVGDPPLPSWTSSCLRCLRSSATNSPRLERLREMKHADEKPGSGTESSPGITRMPAIWKHQIVAGHFYCQYYCQ